jgi:probable F420-dependent oxidoreductase
LRWSICLPGSRAPAALQTPEMFVDAACAIESRGFDAAWATDHPFPLLHPQPEGHQAYDPFVALAFAAASTSRLLLHTNLIVLPYRNPFIVARAAATLDHLAGGRLILAVGAGYSQGEFAALGVDFAARDELMEDGIKAIKAAWTGEPVELQTRQWRAAGNSMLPRPAQRPHPRLWRGGNSRQAVAHAVREFDGWTPFENTAARAPSSRTAAIETLEQLRARIGLLRRLEDEAGRPNRLEVCFVRPRSAWYLQPPEQVHQELAELAAMGVTWLAVQLEDAQTPAEYFEHLDRIGALADIGQREDR